MDIADFVELLWSLLSFSTSPETRSKVRQFFIDHIYIFARKNWLIHLIGAVVLWALILGPLPATWSLPSRPWFEAMETYCTRFDPVDYATRMLLFWLMIGMIGGLLQVYTIHRTCGTLHWQTILILPLFWGCLLAAGLYGLAFLVEIENEGHSWTTCLANASPTLHSLGIATRDLFILLCGIPFALTLLFGGWLTVWLWRWEWEQGHPIHATILETTHPRLGHL